MRKFIIGAALLGLAIPASAQVKAEFDPGQYSYTITASVQGNVMDSKTESDCMTAAESSIGAKEFEAAMPGEMQCSYSNVNARTGKVTSNFSCLLLEMGATFSGTADVNWTRQSFNALMNGEMSGEGIPGGAIPFQMKIDGSRTGSCQ